MKNTPATPSSGGLPSWLRYALRSICHVLLDGTAVWAAYRLAFWARFEWRWLIAHAPVMGSPVGWDDYASLVKAAVPIWLALLYLNQLYAAAWLSAADRFVQIVKVCFLGTVITLTAAFLYERLAYSRLMLAGVFPFALILLSASQALALWVDELLARWEAARPVLLIGGGLVAGVLRERILARHPGARVRELNALPPLEELERLLDGQGFGEAILLNARGAHERVLAAAEACEARGVRFTMIPDLLEVRLGELAMDHHLGVPAYRIQHASLSPANFFAKRVFDIVFSTLFLTITAPLWLTIGLIIKLDSKGPILFSQPRLGRKGLVFRARKFRTMSADAEKRLAEVKGRNGDGSFFKDKNDPRVTRAGRFLRRFSLDEFPQFLNVLKGEMSVVGPRPLAVSTGEMSSLERAFGETARKRLNVLPGITGLWQVSGRSDVSNEQRFSLDLYYIERWSLGLDLEIILKTPFVMIFGSGAY